MEEVQPGREVVVLQAGFELCRINPFKSRERFANPVLNDEITHDRKLIVVIGHALVAQQCQQALNAEKTLSLVVLAITLGAWLCWMRRRRTSLIEKTINLEAEEGSLAADGTGISRETTPLAQTDEKHTEDVA